MTPDQIAESRRICEATRERPWYDPTKHDRQLAAHARTALPAALDEIERLRAENNRYHRLISKDTTETILHLEAEGDRLRAERDRLREAVRPLAKSAENTWHIPTWALTDPPFVAILQSIELAYAETGTQEVRPKDSDCGTRWCVGSDGLSL